MGKRRHSAKTGDKKLYARRPLQSIVSTDPEEDSHTQRDASYMLLESDNERERSLDEQLITRQHVLDLGVSDGSSEGEYNSDDGSMEDFYGNQTKRESGSVDDHSDSDEVAKADELNDIDPRNWGKKKAAYYDADTGDLEIGQDKQDAFIEETAARGVQTSRFGEMDQGDFVFPDEEVESSALLPHKLKSQTEKSIVKLSQNHRRKYLRLQHPELIPISSHFSKVVARLHDSTKVILSAVLDNKQTAKSIGMSKQGQFFILTKAMIEQNISLSTAIYLLVKLLSIQNGQDYQDINAHPVMLQLNVASTLTEEFFDKVEVKSEQLQDQVNSLIQAAALIPTLSSSKRIERDPAPVKQGRSDKQRGFRVVDLQSLPRSPGGGNVLRSRRVILHDARFGLRRHEIHQISKNRGRQITKVTDVGDASDYNDSSRYLAATINAIDQRAAATSTNISVIPTDDEEFLNMEFECSEGVKLMGDEFEVRRVTRASDSVTNHIKEFHSVDERSRESNFYDRMAETATRRKRLREENHKVSPKFPKFEAAVTGERAISTMILKNRGLVPHKAKINRNPRVKKRLQYRKALIRRKGAVRGIRTEEGHKYSGEETGIKSRITRSRKLAL